MKYRLVSAPRTIWPGWLFDDCWVGTGVRPATTPAVVIEPTMGLPVSRAPVNQRFPSGPVVIDRVEAGGVSGNALNEPVGVIRPIAELASVNQSAPSGPVVMLDG